MHSMTFGEATKKLKEGKKIYRRHWERYGMFLWLEEATFFMVDWAKDAEIKYLINQNGGKILMEDTICMYKHDHYGQPAIITGWTASQEDILAEDWFETE